MSATEDLLAERYGKKKAPSRTQRRWLIAGTSSLLVAFLGWAAWVSIADWLQPKAELLGFTIVDKWQSTAT